MGTRSLPRVICSECCSRVRRKVRDDDPGSGGGGAAAVKRALERFSPGNIGDEDEAEVFRGTASHAARTIVRAATAFNKYINSAYVQACQDHFVSMIDEAMGFKGGMQMRQSNPSNIYAGPAADEPARSLREKLKQKQKQQEQERRQQQQRQRQQQQQQQGGGAGQRPSMGVQQFGIQQSAAIRLKLDKLRHFWRKHGPALKAHWAGASDREKARVTMPCVYCFVESCRHLLESKENGQLQTGNNVDDLQDLTEAPLGRARKGYALLPELTQLLRGLADDDPNDDDLNDENNAAPLSLVELFESRCGAGSANCHVSEDVADCTRLLLAGELPKLGLKPRGPPGSRDTEFLCDYMLHDPVGRPFVVYMGDRSSRSQFDEEGGEDDVDKAGDEEDKAAEEKGDVFMTAKRLVRMDDYVPLRTWQDTVHIYSCAPSAVSRNPVGNIVDRTLLGLVQGRAASHAAAYVYAAMKQWHLLQFMHTAATSWAEDVVPNFDASREGAFKSGSVCFVCGALEGKDGGKLLTCAKCRHQHSAGGMFYCSRE